MSPVPALLPRTSHADPSPASQGHRLPPDRAMDPQYANLRALCDPPSELTPCEQPHSTAAMSTSGRTRRSRSSKRSSSPMCPSAPAALLPGRTGLSAGRMICTSARTFFARGAQELTRPQPNPSLQLQHEREDHVVRGAPRLHPRHCRPPDTTFRPYCQ